MQRLRTLPLAKTQTGIELAQALTVVVLAADMLVQDHHTTDPEISALLCHNADRAWALSPCRRSSDDRPQVIEPIPFK